MNTLERRVEALEKHRAKGDDAITTIVISLVRPGLLHLEPHFADVYGETLTRVEGESVDGFNRRAIALAHELKPAGRRVATVTLRPDWEALHD